MEWELVKPWVNRVGIVLEFLSFWLAAPEILGEERLRALERRLERGIKQLPGAVVTMQVVGALLAMMVIWMAMTRAVAAGLVAVVAKVVAAMIVMMVEEVTVQVASVVSVVAALVTMGAAGVLAWAVTRAVVLGVRRWRGEKWRWPWGLAIKLQEKVVSPWLRVLADDKRIRQRSLAVGAVLFVVGFLLQLIATF